MLRRAGWDALQVIHVGVAHVQFVACGVHATFDYPATHEGYNKLRRVGLARIRDVLPSQVPGMQ